MGIGVFPGVPILSNGIYSCISKWVKLYTLSLLGKDAIDISGLGTWYELQLIEKFGLLLDGHAFSKKSSDWMWNFCETKPGM